MSTTIRHEARSEVIAWIDDILARKRWTGTDLARKAGLAPSTILRMLNDPGHQFTPSLRTLKKIAEGSGSKIPATIVNAIEDDQPETRPARGSRAGLAQGRGKTNTIPVRTMSTLPTALQPGHDQNSVVACPHHLEGDATAFAFYLAESYLEPWIKPGTLMYATRRRDPVAGDVVLVTRKDGRAVFRLLMEINETGVVLTRSRPPVPEMEIPFDDIAEIGIMAGFIAQV